MRRILVSNPIISEIYLPMIDKNRHNARIKEVTFKRNKGGIVSAVDDFIAVEAPLHIEVNGKTVCITLRTPGDDMALSLGILFSEGVINDYNAVADVVQKDINSVNIIPEDGYVFHSDLLLRNLSGSISNKTSLVGHRKKTGYFPQEKNIKVSAKTLFSLQERLLAVQSAFELTGGLHACALFTPDGRYLFHSEDVDKHNALDKLIGHSLMAGRLPLNEHILLLSGRVGFAQVHKAFMAGIPVISAVGAPSSLAIDHASENHQTLIGFLKKSGFNIYCGSERVL